MHEKTYENKADLADVHKNRKTYTKNVEFFV